MFSARFDDAIYDVDHAYMILFALMLPTAFFLTNAPVWDDPYIFEAHAHWSWQALFGPYMANAASYWRPLTVLTIAVPNLLGVSILANKLISLILAFIQAAIVVTLLENFLRNSRRISNSLSLIVLAVVLALHPIFVESTLWISARADLLMTIFMLSGLLWLTRTHHRQIHHQQPNHVSTGFLCGFSLVWLMCASKDTGIVWTGFALIAGIALSKQSHGKWRRYWIVSTAGIGIAVITYLLARKIVLGQINGVSGLEVRHTQSIVEQLQVLTEFLIRSALMILLPYLDQAPFKSAGWFSNVPTIWLLVILFFGALCAALLLIRIYRNNRTGAYFVLCAFAAILVHAWLTVFSEITFGSLVSGRYLAPSALLIYLTLAMSLQHQPNGFASKRLNMPVALCFGLLLIQSLLLWSAERLNWSTNLRLWETSWQHNSRTRIVAENYSRAYYHLNNFVAARSISQTWLQENQSIPMSPDLCNIYVNLLGADIALSDQADGERYARIALPIGTCRLALVRDITIFLLKSDCKEVLPMLYRAIEEGDKTSHAGRWQFLNNPQRIEFQLDIAWAEVHCGDPAKARDILESVSHFDPSWQIDSDKAQRLLN